MDEIKNVEEISVIHVAEMSKVAGKEVQEKGEKMFGDTFKGFAEIRMVSSSPMRIDSVEPIEGTDVDWIKKNGDDTEIDMSDIF